MARVTPSEYGAKWSQNLQNAQTSIQRGIERVSESPMEKAVAKQNKLVQNFNAAVQSGKWAANTKAVTLADWKQAALTKGLPRIGQGAMAAQNKMASFGEKLLPAIDAARAKIQNMPDLTLSDNIARMTTFVTEMSKFKK